MAETDFDEARFFDWQTRFLDWFNIKISLQHIHVRSEAFGFGEIFTRCGGGDGTDEGNAARRGAICILFPAGETCERFKPLPNGSVLRGGQKRRVVLQVESLDGPAQKSLPGENL